MSARVLAVDDVEVDIRVLEAKLSSDYFTVLAAGSGAAALQSARSGGPTSCCSMG
jgi:two-component system, cell cycle response regulator